MLLPFHLSDIEQHTKGQQTQTNDINLEPKARDKGLSFRPSKVRGANLPQEYELARLLGDNENLPTTWSTSTPACEWKGTHCNTDGYVTGLNWDSFSLTGTLRWDWLPRSVVLCNVMRNKLTGHIHTEKLPPQLRYLLLSVNRFTNQGDLTCLPLSLEDFVLDENHCHGNVDLTHLSPRLSKLSLRSNFFSGEVNLTGLPASLTYLVRYLVVPC